MDGPPLYPITVILGHKAVVQNRRLAHDHNGRAEAPCSHQFAARDGRAGWSFGCWPAGAPRDPEGEDRAAAAYAEAARAASTRRAYDSDWAIFTEWCAAHALVPLPATPEIVAVFAADQATGGFNPSTINRRIAAIGHHHRAAGLPAPTAMPTAGRLAEVLAGIRAQHGKPKQQKSPTDAAALRHILAPIKGDGLRAKRDRAVLAIGMAAAMRRSELVPSTSTMSASSLKA